MSARRGLMFALALALLGATATLAAAAPRPAVRLAGSRSPALAEARALDALAPTQELRFAITLPMRDPAGLEALLQHLYTPGDPLFHQFLKTGEVAERFGPTQADYDAVQAFVQAQGLRVTATFANRAVLDVAGPVAAIERALGVHLLRYQSPSGRIFHGPDAEPTVPADIAARIAGITDLDDAAEPHSNLVKRPARAAGEATARTPGRAVGSGPNSDYTPSDIKAMYDMTGVPETGAFQSLALFELDGYKASDITAYEDRFGLPHVTLTNTLIDGVTGTPTAATTAVPYPAGPAEVTLDIELAIAMMPGASSIQVYEGTSYVNLYNRIASDNSAKEVSSSWYYGIETAPSVATRNSENSAFQTMAAQGQSFFAATGDFGDKVKTGTDSNGNPILTFGVQDPTAQPWVTAVGGTTLNTLYAGAPYSPETAWSGSTGGVSTIWSLPNYQSQVVPPGTGGSATFRNLPDVSLDSDPNTGYAVYYYGLWQTYGGTSCAAPLWAAYTALVNQRRSAHGAGLVGFLNPLLYYLVHTDAAAHFHDVTSGNNGTYSAVAGYDNVTGWGSFDGGLLFNDLQGNANILYVDGTYNGLTRNGQQATPFNLIGSALNAASATTPTLVYVKGFHYLENPTFTKPMVLVPNGAGIVTIGQ